MAVRPCRHWESAATGRRKSRRMIEGGGISLNDQKVSDFRRTISSADLKENYVIIRRGKKNGPCFTATVKAKAA